MAYLWLDQDQVDEEHDKVMLDVLVAEAAAVAAHCQADVVAARLVARTRVLRPQRLDRVPALDADRHGGRWPRCEGPVDEVASGIGVCLCHHRCCKRFGGATLGVCRRDLV